MTRPVEALEVARSLIDGLGARVCLLGRAGRIVESNAGWAREVEAPWPVAGPRLGMGADLIAALDRAAAEDPTLAGVAEGVRAVLAGDRARFDHEGAVTTAGETRWWLLTATPAPSGGAVEGAVVAYTELTEAHRAGRAAAASREQRYGATIAAMAEGVAVHDASGRVVEINPAAAEIFGVPRDEYLSRSLLDRRWDVVGEDGSPIANEDFPAVRVLRTGKPERGLLGVMRPDGRRAWIDVAVAPVFADGGARPSHAVATFADVSERRLQYDLRRTLAEIDRQIIGRENLDEILEAVCRGVVGLGLRLAWIGLARPGGRVEVRCRAGAGAGYLDGLEIRWDDSPAGRGPTGRAIRTGAAVVVNDVQADAFFEPFRERAARHGLRSAAAVPLPSQGGAAGTLVAWSGEAGTFDPPLVELLTMLAQEAALAIQAAQTHAQLVESEERHRLLVEAAADYAIYAVDLDGRIASWNAGAERLYGYRSEEAIGLPWSRLTADEGGGVKYVEEQLARALAGGSKGDECRRRRRDGSTFVASASVTPMRSEAGDLVGFAVISRDLTAERKAEEAMRRVTTAIEQASEAICITDPSGVIEYVNPAYCRLTGYAADEVLGRSTRILMSGVQDAAFYEDLWKTILAGRVWNGVLTNRRKDGATYEESLVIAPVRNDGAIVNFVALKRDVTRERALEAQLRQAQKLEAVGQLAGGIAHDFNNALAGVIGYCDLALMELKAEDPLRATLLEVRRSGDRAAAIARQLLVFSRRQKAELRVVDLNEVVRGVAKMLRQLIGEDVKLEIDLAQDLAPVRADVGLLEQVITNLCVNARDAMPAGGRLTIATTSAAGEASPARSVVLSVTDTGSGMSAAVKTHLFEPFFTTKPPGKGTGLGLAVVHGIVAEHEGRIEVESEPGRGTTMRCTFPAADERVVAAGAASEPPPPRGEETVLVVDDDECVRDVAARLLERQGYRVLVAASGFEALGLADEHSGAIDLLLCDVVMPGLSGPEVVAKLSAKRPGLQVLFVSGYSGDALTKRGVELSGWPVLAKPVSLAALAAKVRELLDARTGPRSSSGA